MSAPRRIQLRRTRGWTNAGAVVVSRPSRWGNPFPVSVHGRDEAIRLYREHLLATPELLAAVETQLAGRDLACWCKLADPCHADVLLSVANPGTDTPAARPLKPSH